jgi:hypothetical protein
VLTSDEEMERNLGEGRRMIVLHECDGMNVQYRYSMYYKISKYHATKPFNNCETKGIESAAYGPIGNNLKIERMRKYFFCGKI